MKFLKVADPAAEAARLRRASAIPDSVLADAMAIMKDVAAHGDQAVLDYTAKFDGAQPDSLLASKHEIKQAYGQVTKEQVKAVKLMKERLAKSELAVLKRLKGIAVSSNGARIDRMVKPVASVGCYVPGGKARYPST
jgi:histidinol dehydrogenase